MRPRTVEPPDDFGRYALVEEVARGSYGLVYRARDRQMKREVALKVLRYPDAGRVTRERFSREARLAASLSHPGIVRVLESGEHDGRPYYTMPLLEGTPLRGPRPPAEAIPLMARVAEAVAHAHARGVVHRDLKPNNILLCDDGPVITDFGVARGVRDRRVTETGDLVGTPSHMSPEQIRGRGKDADAKADVYAIGVMIHELLTGAPPFVAETFVELSTRILNDAPPPLTGFDPELERLVKRCLAKSPGARPTALEVARRLRGWIPQPRRHRGLAVALSLAAVLALGTLLAGMAIPDPPARDGMVRIPGGTYEVGDPRFGRRRVTVEPFWIDRREGPARLTGYTYHEALQACLRRGKRLPTEEEWEIAAGPGIFPWGDEAEAWRAGCEGDRSSNAADESPFGVRDMAGRMSEWTATEGRRGPGYRVLRGGNFESTIEACTVYARREESLDRRPRTAGYRCVSRRGPGRGQ